MATWLLVAAGILAAFGVLLVVALCRGAARADEAIRAAILRERAKAHQREQGHA